MAAASNVEPRLGRRTDRRHQLGSLFTDGFTARRRQPIVLLGILLCILLALILDTVIVLTGRLLTTWQQGGAPDVSACIWNYLSDAAALVGHGRRAGTGARAPRLLVPRAGVRPASSRCPLGLYIGHTGRGSVVIAGTRQRAAGAARPSACCSTWSCCCLRQAAGRPGLPAAVGAGPGRPRRSRPILSTPTPGIQNVDPAARDAAKGMGMTGTQVLWRVEVPNALPLILSGLRSAMLQVDRDRDDRRVRLARRVRPLHPSTASRPAGLLADGRRGGARRACSPSCSTCSSPASSGWSSHRGVTGRYPHRRVAPAARPVARQEVVRGRRPLERDRTSPA